VPPQNGAISLRETCRNIVAEASPGQRFVAVDEGVGTADKLVQEGCDLVLGKISLGQGQIRCDGAVETAELIHFPGGEALDTRLPFF
jgi:hypothetical protein